MSLRKQLPYPYILLDKDRTRSTNSPSMKKQTKTLIPKDSKPKLGQSVPKKIPRNAIEKPLAQNLSQVYKNKSSHKTEYLKQSVTNSSSILKTSSYLGTRDKNKRSFDLKFDNIYLKLESQLRKIEKSPNPQSIPDYFDLLDEISSKDLTFGPYLRRIKTGLKYLFLQNQDLRDYNKILEEKIIEKQSIINKYIISNSSSLESLDKLSADLSKQPSLTSYPFELIDDLQSKIRETIQTENNAREESKKLSEKIKQLEIQLSTYQEKDKKCQGLIKALIDRGYPLQEIYSNDVVNNESTENPSNFLFPSSFTYTLSSDEN